MFELLLLIPVVIVGVIVVSVLALVFSLILLPFKLLGLLLRGIFGLVGLLLAAPLVLGGALIAALVGGSGLAVVFGLLAIPLLPLFAIGALVWWLVKPKHRARETSGATVVG